jgi:hypothetical protein
MRKFVLLAAAGWGLALASPASAQFYRPYGYGYGFGQHQEIVSGLERRIYNVLGTINSAPYDQQYRLRAEAISLDRQVRYAARNGLNPPNELWIRLERLEIEAQRAARYGRYGYDRYRDYNGYYGDRRPHRGDWDRDDDND